MRKLPFPLTIAAAMCFVPMLAAPAQAQLLPHTWVASNGNDGAICSRLSPCQSFQIAHDKTSAGGEISCVDSGGYNGLTITKSITIICQNVIGANSVGTTWSNIVVNTSAADVVFLRGLDIGGFGSSFAGVINFSGAGVLHVDKVKITNVRGSSSGVRFAPNGPARLDVSDSFIADNGGDASTAGILIRPTSGGSANISVSHSDIKGNVNGIFVDGSVGGGAVNLDVRDSVVTGSSNVGIVLATSGPSLSALIERTTINSSLNVGVATSGAAAIARISDSTIYGNVTGIAAFNGSTIRSYKNNRINGNLTDGTPLPARGIELNLNTAGSLIGSTAPDDVSSGAFTCRFWVAEITWCTRLTAGPRYR